jgi:predicted nucleotidyltransferase
MILFGSRARGDTGLECDVDLIVLFEGRVEDRLKIVADMHAAMRGVLVPIDLYVYGAAEYKTEVEVPGSTAQKAHREGRVIYEAAS